MLSNPRMLKGTAIGLVAVVVVVAAYLRIQSLGTGPVRKAPQSTGEEPLDKARGMLQQSSAVGTCRSALQQVNSHLSRQSGSPSFGLAPAAREELAQLGLSEAELDEIENPSFTLLDGIHLEAALLMRDAANSLLPQAGPRRPEEEAAVLFSWVMRQVQTTSVTELDLDSGKDQMPPQLVLRRAVGPSLGRAVLFLALLEQRGHDGCLISFPNQREASPRYWACGVRGTGNKIYLFDPRLGLPLPGPNGAGVATLDLMTSKDSPVLGQLNLEKDGRHDVTPDIAAGAELHLTPSLSSLAPRMAYLEKEVLPQMGVRVTSRWSDARERFRASLQSIGHRGVVKLAPWAIRLQRGFFPPEEGGVERTGLLQKFRRSVAFRGGNALLSALQGSLPREVVPTPERDIDPPLDLLFHYYAKRFTDFYLGSNQPRDQMLHGNLAEASRLLGTTSDGLQLQQDVYRANFDGKSLLNWFTEASNALATPGQSPEGRSRAVQQVWNRHERNLAMLIQGAAAEELLVHVAFLLAQVKHEQAERVQLLLGPASSDAELIEAEKSWQSALTLWKGFLYQPQESFLIAPARYLRACAQHRAAEVALLRANRAAPADRRKAEEHARNTAQAAIGFWQDLAGERTDLEALGFRFQARQLQKKLAEK